MNNAPAGAANSHAFLNKSNPLRPLRKKPKTATDPLRARKPPVPIRKPAPAVTKPISTLADIEATRRRYGGWSQPLPDGAQTFALLTTKRSERDSTRFHVMRLVRPGLEHDKNLDPSDPVEFPRPVTLSRRDPLQPPTCRMAKDQNTAFARTEDEKEIERMQQARAERDTQKASDLSMIAPLQNDFGKRPRKSRLKENSKPVGDLRPPDDTKASSLHYEEALPWHLEDADNKNIWVGNYVSALSESNPAVANVAFVIDRPGFRMIPLEKWYKFTSKPPFTPYSIDQAEALMSKKTDLGRWLMRDQEKKQTQEDWAATRHFVHGVARVKTESATFKSASKLEKLDHDDIDMSGDEFQDDDENQGYDAENEDEKDAKDRIRREQLGANLFGDADEEVVDKEEAEKAKEKENLRKVGKPLKEVLIKREREMAYETDSSIDPFGEISNDDSSDEGSGSDEEPKGKAKPDDKNQADIRSVAKASSTASAKPKVSPDGGREEKSLKRPGSPNMSESSGNESAEKRPRERSGTSKPAFQSKLRASAGPTGGIDADNGDSVDSLPVKKKIKLFSPRLGSPRATGAMLDQTSNIAIESWEIVNALPPTPEGISIGNLMKIFSTRIGDNPGQITRKDWIKLVSDNAAWGSDRLLRRKPPASPVPVATPLSGSSARSDIR